MGLEDDIQWRATQIRRQQATAHQRQQSELQRYEAELWKRWNELQKNLAVIAKTLADNGVPPVEIIEKFQKNKLFSSRTITAHRHAADGWRITETMCFDKNGRLWIRESQLPVRGLSREQKDYFYRRDPAPLSYGDKKFPFHWHVYELLLSGDGSLNFYRTDRDGSYSMDLLHKASELAARLIATQGSRRP